MPSVQAFLVRRRRTPNTNAVRIGKPKTFSSYGELVAHTSGLSVTNVRTACRNDGALAPAGGRRVWIVWDEDGDHRRHEEIFQGYEADDFSVASSNASDTDSDDDDACYEFPAMVNAANMFSGGPTVGSPLEKCTCGCGGYFAPADGSVASSFQLAQLHKEKFWLFPEEMRPDAALPLGYKETMAIMAKGNMDELQKHYSTDERWVERDRALAGDASNGDGDGNDDPGTSAGAGTAADGDGPSPQSAIKAAVASPEFNQAMELMKKAFSGMGLQAVSAAAAGDRYRKPDGKVVEESEMIEAFGNVALSVVSGSMDKISEASDELKKVTIPSNVPTLVLFRKPHFHRLVVWFMKHGRRSRMPKYPYDELVSDYAEVIQAVDEDIDRHQFDSVAAFSNDDWDNPTSTSSRRNWVASTYLNLVRRWTRSFAFGRPIALHSLPLQELKGLSAFDHVTNAPGEDKGGVENGVSFLARSGPIWKVLREQSRCELVASWDNATGVSARSSSQLRRERSSYEGKYYYDVHDVKGIDDESLDDDSSSESTSNKSKASNGSESSKSDSSSSESDPSSDSSSSESDPLSDFSSDSSDEDPGTPPRMSRTGKRGGAGAARTPDKNRRERKKSQKN